MRTWLAWLLVLTWGASVAAAAEPVSPPAASPGLPAELELATPEQIPGTRKVPLTLLEAVRIGLARNVELKKSLLDRATQVGDLELAERMFEPEPYLKAFYRHNSLDNQDQRGGGAEVVTRLMTNGTLTFDWQVADTLDRDRKESGQTGHLNLSLHQPLLRGAGITVGTAELVSARYADASEVQGLRASVMSRITAIVNAYWNLLLALENRLSTVRALQASRELLERNKVLIKAGRMAPADLVQTEQEVARAKVNILEQDFSVQAANRILADHLDLGPEVVIRPVEGFTFKEIKLDFNRMMASAEEQSPALKQSRINLRQAELDLALAQSGARDVLDLNLGASLAKGETADQSWDDSQNYQVGLELAIPLGLPRDRLRQEVVRAQRRVKKSRLDLHQAKLALGQNVRTGVNDVRRSLLQIKMAQDSRRLALRKYQIERNRLELGRSSNFQVLSYQRDLVSAADAEHQAIVNYLNSLSSLEEVAGSTLETWGVKINQSVAPKLPSISLGASQRPH